MVVRMNRVAESVILFILAGAGLGCLLGCDMGTITKRGLSQYQIIEAKKGLHFDGGGPQAASFIYARGTKLRINNEDGTVDVNGSGNVEEYMWYEPSAEVAGSTILGGMEQQQMAWTNFLTLAGQIAPLIPGANQPLAQPQDNETNRLLRALLVELRDQPDEGTR